MILESIVTTVSEQREINIAPMGPIVRNPQALRGDDGTDPEFLLRPFEGSRTLTNLLATRRATIHVTDNAVLFADAVMGSIEQPGEHVFWHETTLRHESALHPETVPHAVLRHCQRWFAVQIDVVDDTPPRYEMGCQVIASGIRDPFGGFNRAKHALIEAAILATRTHLIAADSINEQLEWLRPWVEKTAGSGERDAFVRLEAEISKRMKLNGVEALDDIRKRTR